MGSENQVKMQNGKEEIKVEKGRGVEGCVVRMQRKKYGRKGRKKD